jgi:hypothetical protein
MNPDELAVLSHRYSNRHWATGHAPGSLTAEEAEKRVAAVLAEQIVPPDFFEGLGEKLFFGLFHCNEVFGTIWPTSEQIDDAIVTAEKDYGTFSALNLIGQMTNQGVHPNLDTWKFNLFNGLVVIPSRPKGLSKFSLRQRDMLIVGQIQELTKVGFKPTRSSTVDCDESGCGIVAKATHRVQTGMTYQAVERVWKRRDLPVPGNAVKEFIEEYYRVP